MGDRVVPHNFFFFFPTAKAGSKLNGQSERVKKKREKKVKKISEVREFKIEQIKENGKAKTKAIDYFYFPRKIVKLKGRRLWGSILN